MNVKSSSESRRAKHIYTAVPPFWKKEQQSALCNALLLADRFDLWNHKPTKRRGPEILKDLKSRSVLGFLGTYTDVKPQPRRSTKTSFFSRFNHYLCLPIRQVHLVDRDDRFGCWARKRLPGAYFAGMSTCILRNVPDVYFFPRTARVVSIVAVKGSELANDGDANFRDARSCLFITPDTLRTILSIYFPLKILGKSMAVSYRGSSANHRAGNKIWLVPCVWWFERVPVNWFIDAIIQLMF